MSFSATTVGDRVVSGVVRFRSLAAAFDVLVPDTTLAISSRSVVTSSGGITASLWDSGCTGCVVRSAGGSRRTDGLRVLVDRRTSDPSA